MAISYTLFDSEAFCGYTQMTTFFMDFGIAENFGIEAVQDTYNRAFRQWKHDYKYLTELVMVLNWKSWQHADDCVAKNSLCNLYVKLYSELNDWCYDNLKGDALKYFIQTTD